MRLRRRRRRSVTVPAATVLARTRVRRRRTVSGVSIFPGTLLGSTQVGAPVRPLGSMACLYLYARVTP